jgi:hypothetical protein
MKKYFFIAIIIVLAAVFAAMNIAPTDAKTPAAGLPPPNTVGEVLAKKIPAPVPAATSTTADIAVKKAAPAASTQAVKETAPVKKVTTTVKTTAKTTTTGVRWATSGLNAIGSLASFDYSTSIRNSYKKKVEAYAKRNGITLITASVVNSMHQ